MARTAVIDDTPYKIPAPAKPPFNACATPGGCDCGVSVPRRDFLRLTALSLAGLAAARWPAVAGPFTAADSEQLVPADKKLSPAWLRSLVERGMAARYEGDELKWIGMPVGGVCAGQLYLGGDGRLWLWDIFNQPNPPEFGSGAGPHYAHPVEPFSPIEQGFALKWQGAGETRRTTLDRQGFRKITFRGQYPIGFVDYEDPDLPLRVHLEAFSPLIPLKLDDSSLPATVMEFTVENPSQEPIEVELAGWLENAACLASGQPGRGSRRNRVYREQRLTFVHGTAEAASEPPARAKRPDILFDDFERERYERWAAEGTAFGEGPVVMAAMPSYQGQVGGRGRRVVNTHNTRQGEGVAQADEHRGTLTSQPFLIERDFINFLIGGGGHRDKTCIQLLVDDQVRLSATGLNDNRMHPHAWDVRAWAGRPARLRVVDAESGGWGNIGIDDIVFSDTARPAPGALAEEEDFGSLSLALLGPAKATWAEAGLPVRVSLDTLFSGKRTGAVAETPFGRKLCGAVGRRWKLKPGAKVKATFVIAWHFPAVRRGPLSHVTDIGTLRRSYARRFGTAADVVRYVAANFGRLSRDTRLWHRTWYEDSTLPWWFLDRTFLNNSIAATATCYHFDNGRFYGWEGTYCCAGTCQHVWQYAQGLARVFPQLERAAREITDYGIAFHADTGALDYRAEAHRVVAIDGQAGTILRVYREHQMSADDAFVRRLWPRVKQSIVHLLQRDDNEDGILDGEQYNTLDASWYGEIPWLSSLYLAALQAGAAMAREMGDPGFAARCERVVESGRRLIVQRLFNGEYFIQRVDPARTDSINTNEGCHIDQVYGQSWAFQVGLPRVLAPEPTRKALEALWRYNFTPDVGPYREKFKVLPGGRWYAMPGEGGLLMCTFPKGGAEKASGKGEPGFVAYFNECMTGFEYQVAGHMLWEGLVEKGLAIARMIHDRYHPARRNPWNEVECSNHYARAMASHGVYLAACGFEYHGPKGHIGFAPRLHPDDFRAAFTAAEGWGTYSQRAVSAGPRTDESGQRSEITVRWGQLRVRTMAVETTKKLAGGQVTVECRGRRVRADHEWKGSQLMVRLRREVVLSTSESLRLTVVAV